MQNFVLTSHISEDWLNKLKPLHTYTRQ